ELILGPLRKGSQGIGVREFIQPEQPADRRPRGRNRQNIGADIMLELWEVEGVFRGVLQFRSDLFRLETAERIRRFFLNVLRAGIATPGKPLSELPIMEEDECNWLLTRGQTLPPPSAPTAWVHQIIEANAQQTPDAIAVSSGDQRLSYA